MQLDLVYVRKQFWSWNMHSAYSHAYDCYCVSFRDALIFVRLIIYGNMKHEKLFPFCMCNTKDEH